MMDTGKPRVDADLMDRLVGVWRLAGSDWQDTTEGLRSIEPDELQRYVRDLEKAGGTSLADWNASAWLQGEESVPYPTVLRLGRATIQTGRQEILVPVGIRAVGRLLVIRHDKHQRDIAVGLANAVAVRALAAAVGGEVELSFFDPIGGGDSLGSLNGEDAPALRKSFRIVIAVSALLTRQLQLLAAESERPEPQKHHVVLIYDFPSGVTAEARTLWRALGTGSSGNVTRIAVMSNDMTIEIPSSSDADVIDLSTGELFIEGLRLHDIDFVPDRVPAGAAFTALQDHISSFWNLPASTNPRTALPALPSSTGGGTDVGSVTEATSNSGKISKESYFSHSALVRLGLSELLDDKESDVPVPKDLLERAYANRLAQWRETFADDTQGFTSAESALREARDKLSIGTSNSRTIAPVGAVHSQSLGTQERTPAKPVRHAPEPSGRWPVFITVGVLLGVMAIVSSQSNRAEPFPVDTGAAMAPVVDASPAERSTLTDSSRSDSLSEVQQSSSDSSSESTDADSAYQAALVDSSYFDYQVTRQATALTEIEPTYPEAYKAIGTEEVVNVQFVVDTTGRVDPLSIKPLNAPEGLFLAAIRTALNSAQFSPAEVNGTKVRQIVEHSFKFSP